MARLAIDLHGGDFGPSVLIPSAFQFFREYPQHHGVLIGDSRVFKPFVHQCPGNIEWIDADPIGDLAQKPAKLLRQAGFSSIEIGYKALKNNDVDLLVSSEHTGVLLALMAKYGELHALLNRPVLASWLPTFTGRTVMLDLGASFTATRDQLLAFAAVGVGVAKIHQATPRLSLLNVGTEFFKGPAELRAADEYLAVWSEVNYQGFIEASEIFTGETDVIVTDGFTGNSIIKSAEGAMQFTYKTLKQTLGSGPLMRLLGFWLKKELKQMLMPLDPRAANGALVAGSDLLVIKSHGNAKEKAFKAALQQGVDAFEAGVTSQVLQQLDQLLNADSNPPQRLEAFE